MIKGVCMAPYTVLLKRNGSYLSDEVGQLEVQLSKRPDFFIKF